MYTLSFVAMLTINFKLTLLRLEKSNGRVRKISNNLKANLYKKEMGKLFRTLGSFFRVGPLCTQMNKRKTTDIPVVS